MKNTQRGSATLILLAIVFFVGFIFFVAGFETVQAGTVKVVTSFGKVTGRVLEPGAHWVKPFVDTTKTINTKFLLYETMKEEDFEKSDSDYKDVPVDTNTKDGQGVDVFYTITFSVDGTKSTQVVNEFGSEKLMVDKVIRANSRSIARIVPSNFTAEELYSGAGKSKLGTLIFDEMKKEVETKGIVLDSVLIREIGFSEEYKTAIENKQIEAVNIETAKNVALRAEQEKITAVTQAEAQAETQRLQSQTISPEYLQKQLIERWDGHYPQYMVTGAGSQFILPLPNR